MLKESEEKARAPCKEPIININYYRFIVISGSAEFLRIALVSLTWQNPTPLLNELFQHSYILIIKHAVL